MEILLIVLMVGAVTGVVGYILGQGKFSARAEVDAIALLQEAQAFFQLRMDLAEKEIRMLTERIQVLEARIRELEQTE